MTKHKSPWRIETNSMGKVAVICSADGWPIARMVEDSDKESAALMAAAPSLYAYAASKSNCGDNEALKLLEMIDGRT